MKKIASLAVAGLLTASAANAGEITVANTDITMFGGVSTSYNAQNNDHALSKGDFKKDSFSVNNVIVGLTKPAQDGGIGFTAAFGSFEVPTVVASSDVINNYQVPGSNKQGLVGLDQTTKFRPWLTFITYKPVAGLNLDAGLLWTNFGEKPITILNPHITRGILFTANPVLLEGARATYDAGDVAKIYIGTGKAGKDQLFGQCYRKLNNYSNYIEAGITSNLKQLTNLPINIGLHTYNENGNRDIYALTVDGNLGMVSAGLETDYFKADDGLKNAWNTKTGKTTSSDAWATALYTNVKPATNIQIPVRIEYANNKNTVLIPTIAAASNTTFNGTNYDAAKKVWTFTITPTYNPTKNTFLRSEISYIRASGSIDATKSGYLFTDDKGEPKNSRTAGAVELGFLF